MATTTLAERIEEIRATTGWTITRIGAEAGVSRSAVSQWLGNSTKLIKSLDMAPAMKLQTATGYSALWIALGEGPKLVGRDAGDQWPFRFARERFDRLDDRDKGVVERAALIEIERIESRGVVRQSAS